MSILKLILNGLDTQYFALKVTVKSYNDNAISKEILYPFIKCIVKAYIIAICGRPN